MILKASFNMFICNLYILSVELSVYMCGMCVCVCVCVCVYVHICIFCPFSNWVVYFLLLSIRNCMYVLDTSLLSDMRFETIFSQFVSCFFILFMSSFLEQKFYLLTKSYLSIFFFYILWFWHYFLSCCK